MTSLIEFDNYNLHFHTSDKFKTFLFHINFINEYDFKRLSVREAMLRLLFLNNKKYRTSLDISKKCEDLYDPYFYFEQYRMGKYVFSNIFIKFIDPKYVNEDDYFESIIEYYFDVIFNPNFNEESLLFVKNSITSDLYSILDDPGRSSLLDFYSCLDKNDPRGVSLLGTIEDINSITLDDIRSEYEKFINESILEVSLVTDKYNKNYIDIINKYSKFNKNKKEIINPYRDTLNVNKEFVKEKEYSQSNLIMLYNFKDLTEKEKNITILLFSEILGGYSVNAILNTKLREENSICYGVNSNYEKYDNSLRIFTSVSINNIDKAIELIKSTIIDFKSITEDDMNNAVKRLILSLKSSDNNIFSFAGEKLFTDLGIIFDSKKKEECLKDITIDEVISILDKLEYNSCYILKGVKNEEN